MSVTNAMSFGNRFDLFIPTQPRNNIFKADFISLIQKYPQLWSWLIGFDIPDTYQTELQAQSNVYGSGMIGLRREMVPRNAYPQNVSSGFSMQQVEEIVKAQIGQLTNIYDEEMARRTRIMQNQYNEERKMLFDQFNQGKENFMQEYQSARNRLEQQLQNELAKWRGNVNNNGPLDANTWANQYVNSPDFQNAPKNTQFWFKMAVDGQNKNE